MRNIFVSALVVLSIAMPRAAAAQGTGRVDAAAGYAWLRDHDGDVTFSRGWFASLGADVLGPLGVVGDVSLNSKSLTGPDVELTMRVLSMMAGPRVVRQTRRVTPFAQILFGRTRISSTYRLPNQTLAAANTFFATQFGGGIDAHVMPHVSVRMGIQRRVFHSDTYTPTGSLPFTFQQTQWFTGLAVR
jgi:hypothetical protein